MQINTVEDFDKALAAGPYAWCPEISGPRSTEMNPPTKPAIRRRLAEALDTEYEDTKRKLWWAWVCSVSLLLLCLLLGLLSVAAIFGSFYISHEFARMWYREPAELLFQFFAAFGGMCSLFCGICSLVSISDIAHHKDMLKKMQ